MAAKIDLSYKDRATRVEYDIESLNSLFSIVFMHKHAVTTVFFGESVYDMVTDEDIRRVTHDYMSEPGKIDSFEGIGSADDLDYHVVRVRTGDKDSIYAFKRLLMKFISCKPLATDDDYDDMSFVEYAGWNSSRYDLPMMVLVNMLVDAVGDSIEPKQIRRLSDLIIMYEGSPWKFPHYIERETAGWANLSARTYKLLLNTAFHSDGHIDWARVAKLNDEDDESSSKYPPGLKMEMARFGFDIVVDDLVAGEGDRKIGRQEILDLIRYNVNDVLGTRLVGMNSTIRAWLETRDIIHKSYTYTSAKSTPFNQLGRLTPAERDATAANLAGTVLIGPKRIKPQDIPAVDYAFPVPDHRSDVLEGKTRIVDLLEHMRETEDFMHDYVYAFFDHFRGRDTQSGYDEYMTAREQPITHSTTMNCPYYRDGKPVDSYIRVSTGGAHGSVMATLSQKGEDEVKQWIKTDAGALPSEKPTIDAEGVLHLDWSSFYPVMASKMRLYETREGVDRYTNIIEQRVKIKESLPFDHAEWAPEDYEKQELQIGMKFILNNATGAGNTHNKFALLPLDNKTLSMRLIGNMLIWCLGQRLTQAGGYIVSTNTDGLYMMGLDIETTQKVVDGYVHDYGMDVEPETLSRFINRDTSNRVEIVNGNVQEVRGRLRHGHHMVYTDDAIGKKVPYPIVVAHAAIRYMAEDPDWLKKPYDKTRMVNLIHELHQQSTDPEAWYQIHVGSGSARLTIDGEQQSKINRVVMTRPDAGKELGSERKSSLKKDECRAAWDAYHEEKASDVIELGGYLGVRWEDALIEDNARLSKMRFARRDVGESGEKVIVPCSEQPPAEFESDEDFDAYWKKSGAKFLVVKDSDGEWQQLKVWRTGALANYTGSFGVTLNSTVELKEFDMSTLDLDAYVAWAEKLLDGWKITADIPEIGFRSIDDTVVEKKSSTRSTRKTRGIDMIDWLYDAHQLSRS